jgi:hypothetical protein
MAKRDWHSRGILGFILAGIFTALAISQKTPAIFIGLAFIFMCIDKYGLGFIKEIKLWIFAAIALIPPFAYILYSGRVAEFKFIEGIGSKHIIPKFMTAVFSPEAINFYKNNLSDSFTFIILILGAIGLCTLIHREDRPILYWAIAMVLEVIVIVSVIKFRYYLIFLTPIISILAGKVLYLFASRLKYIGTIGVFFILICIGYTSYSLVKDDFTVREDVVDFGRVIDEYTDEGDLIVIGYFDPTRISICNRQGWRAQKIEELQQYIDSGADYFILDENGIYNDDGSFRAYLDENFEMEVVEGKYRFYRLSSPTTFHRQ